MVTATEGLPRELLTEVWTARLAYFQSYTIAHPRLVEAKQKLMSAIPESNRNSLVMILGPTGSGRRRSGSRRSRSSQKARSAS